MSESKPKPTETDFTPGFDFKFDPEKVNVEGRERTVTLQQSGLYLFGQDEKFERPTPPVAPLGPGLWIPNPPPPVRRVKFGKTGLKNILELTRKTKAN